MSENLTSNLSTLAKGENQRFLSFSLGQEEFALPLMTVREVIAVPSFTPIPQSPSYFLGVINLRGQVISAIDLRKKLSITVKEVREEAVIIINLGNLHLGLLVDSVNSVINTNSGELSPPPTTEQKHHIEFVTSIYRKKESLVLIIDVAKLLNIVDMKAIEQKQIKAA